jgi:hypothetical protein
MFSQLKKITDERSVLLLYLADELSSSDRQEVEQRLSGEPRLAAELENLRASHAAYLETMSVLDAAMKTAVPLPAAQQRANRAIRQWATRRLANPIPSVRTRRFLPPWVYPMAAAAAVLVAVIWWGVGSGFQRIEDKQNQETDKYAIKQLEDVRHQNLEGLVDAVVGSDTASGDVTADDAAAVDSEDDRSVASADFNADINLFLGLTDQQNGKGATP